MPLGLIDPVETVTPPFFSFRQALILLPYLHYKRLLHANCVEVDALEVLVHHAFANLAHRLALERHLVGVIPFFRASGALRSMQTLKATVQTGMPHMPVATAVAG
jgi:predicted transcriptional regulator